MHTHCTDPYCTPQVEVVEVRPQQGFAASGTLGISFDITGETEIDWTTL